MLETHKCNYDIIQVIQYTVNSSGDEMVNVSFVYDNTFNQLRSAPRKLPNSVK